MHEPEGWPRSKQTAQVAKRDKSPRDLCSCFLGRLGFEINCKIYKTIAKQYKTLESSRKVTKRVKQTIEEAGKYRSRIFRMWCGYQEPFFDWLTGGTPRTRDTQNSSVFVCLLLEETRQSLCEPWIVEHLQINISIRCIWCEFERPCRFLADKFFQGFLHASTCEWLFSLPKFKRLQLHVCGLHGVWTMQPSDSCVYLWKTVHQTRHTMGWIVLLWPLSLCADFFL